MTNLKAPFPYFGGKSRVAEEVWRRFGDVGNYVEPFAGSLAVLLARPHKPYTETVNDKDGLLANFWRAMVKDPEAVIHHADWPVNEADLHARHLWLVREREDLTERLMADPYWFDAKAAGWWVWGISAWIGDTWCTGAGGWTEVNGKFVQVESDGGSAKSPQHLRNCDVSINRLPPPQVGSIEAYHTWETLARASIALETTPRTARDRL